MDKLEIERMVDEINRWAEIARSLEDRVDFLAKENSTLKADLKEKEARLKGYDSIVFMLPFKPLAVPGATDPVPMPEPESLTKILNENIALKTRMLKAVGVRDV